MKHLVHRLLGKLGWRLVKSTIFDEMIHVHHVGLAQLDCFHVLRHIVDPDSISLVVDVGANFGQSALKFATYFPNAKIDAFEPVSDSFQRLLARTANHDRIRATRIALGSSPGCASIHHQASSEWNSLVPEVNQPRGGPSEEISVTTLDELAGQAGWEKIDFLKTDTEGFDLEVLRGASALFERRAVSLIYCEVGFRTEDKCHSYFPAIWELLTAQGFRFAGLFECCYGGTPFEFSYANALFANMPDSPIS